MGGIEVTEQEIDEIINELEKEVENPGSSKRVHISNKPAEESQPSMVDQFKKKVNFPTHMVSPLVAKCVAPDVESFQSNPSEIVKTVNRNAYEIREGVLGMAIDFLRWQTDNLMVLTRESKGKLIIEDIPTSDTVLEVAKKFYSFVENRR
jgi:hypothetical protein